MYGFICESAPMELLCPMQGFEYPSWWPGADKVSVVVVYHHPGWNIPF